MSQDIGNRWGCDEGVSKARLVITAVTVQGLAGRGGRRYGVSKGWVSKLWPATGPRARRVRGPLPPPAHVARAVPTVWSRRCWPNVTGW